MIRMELWLAIVVIFASSKYSEIILHQDDMQFAQLEKAVVRLMVKMFQW